MSNDDIRIEKSTDGDFLVSMNVYIGPVTPKPPKPLYGLLYNWFTVDNEHGLAPEGYKIPTISEIITLVNYLGGEELAGGPLKEVGLLYWDSPNEGATNTSLFTAIGAGNRSYFDGAFLNYKLNLLLWSSSEVDGSKAYPFLITNFTTFVVTYFNWQKKIGAAIRCLRESNDGWVEGEKVIDYDGNEYNTIQIGTQIWLKENLAVTHYKDGTIIPEITDGTTWAALTTGALCAYNNDWSDVFE